jgi:hypothetical protein
MPEEPEKKDIIQIGGETYFSIQGAAAYLGRKRAAMFNYIRRYNLPTYKLPLEGKRIFLRKSDLDALRNGEPVANDPKADPVAA